MLGERYERKNLILLVGTIYAAFLLLLVVHPIAGVAVISVLTPPGCGRSAPGGPTAPPTWVRSSVRC